MSGTMHDDCDGERRVLRGRKENGLPKYAVSYIRYWLLEFIINSFVLAFVILPGNPNPHVTPLTGSSVTGVIIIDVSISLLGALILKAIVDHVWSNESMRTIWAFNFKAGSTIVAIIVIFVLLWWAVTLL